MMVLHTQHGTSAANKASKLTNHYMANVVPNIGHLIILGFDKGMVKAAQRHIVLGCVETA